MVDFQDSGHGGVRGPDPEQGLDRAELVVPARPEYVATIRLAAAALAARCELTVDEIEDLRLAVDEACNLVLTGSAGAQSPAPDRLGVRFELAAGLINVEVSVPGRRAIGRRGPSWLVLDALADSVSTVEDGERSGIALCKRRDTARS